MPGFPNGHSLKLGWEFRPRGGAKGPFIDGRPLSIIEFAHIIS